MTPEILERVRALAIPPAWKDVWICPDPMGHLQATGIDAAGRKQYLYHAKWREHRDRAKFDQDAATSAAACRACAGASSQSWRSPEPTRERVLACAVRLLDVGVFRIGSEEYAEEDGGLGLATLHREHVTVHADSIEFDYPAKGGAQRRQVIADPASYELIATLRRRRAGGDAAAGLRERRRWHPIRSDDINDYLKQQLGEDFSAKDFRTWNGTVMAAVSLGTHGLEAATKTARKRAMDRAVREVSQLLGNTPAVARRSYIDPRVFDRYRVRLDDRRRAGPNPRPGRHRRPDPSAGSSAACSTCSTTIADRPRSRSCEAKLEKPETTGRLRAQTGAARPPELELQVDGHLWARLTQEGAEGPHADQPVWYNGVVCEREVCRCRRPLVRLVCTSCRLVISVPALAALRGPTCP